MRGSGLRRAFVLKAYQKRFEGNLRNCQYAGERLGNGVARAFVKRVGHADVDPRREIMANIERPYGLAAMINVRIDGNSR